AKSARLTAARAGSTVGLRASRASRTYGSTPSKPRGRVRGFCARDGTRESASQDECMKTSSLDPETVRASTVLPPNQGRTESPLLRSGEVFQQTAKRLLRQGVDRIYVDRTQDTHNPRGKIDITDFLKRGLLLHNAVACVVDELSRDVLHNRIIKT